MPEPQVGSNTLLQSVIHKRFAQAAAEIGLPALEQRVFYLGIMPYLRSPSSIFEADESTANKLWRRVLRGQVLLTEVLPDDSLAFYVRATLGVSVLDVRLVCVRNAWTIQTVLSMHPHPFRQTRWFYPSVAAVAVILAAMIGYWVHQPAQITRTRTLVVTKFASPTPTKTPAPTVAKPFKPTPTSPTQSASLTFNLSLGTPLYNLASFLAARHLVPSAMEFDMYMKNLGVDRDIKPGKYTFQSGMSQQQIIQVLRAGPRTP